MDRETVARRNANALIELRRRGVLKTDRLPPAQRALMALMPKLKVPHYGDRGRWTLIMALAFGVPMGGFVAWAASFDADFPAMAGWLLGLGGGLGFGVILTGFLAKVHREMELTPWDQLDTLPEEMPDSRDAYKDMEGDFAARMARMQNRLR